MAWDIFKLLQTQGTFSGMSGTFTGFNYAGLDTLLRAYQIPESEWVFVLEKLLILTTLAAKYWNKPAK